MNIKNKLTVPVAVVAAIVIIIGAVLLAGGSEPVPNDQVDDSSDNEPTALQLLGMDADDLEPGVGDVPTAVSPDPIQQGPQPGLAAQLDADDHIYGNADASVFVIEYADIDCSFCAQLHPTLKQLVDDSDGTIAWVYRHFPIEDINPDAPAKAAAGECVAQLAGNDAFWDYLNGLIAGDSIDTYSNYEIDSGSFESCASSPDTRLAVDTDIVRAIQSGGRGTPHAVVATNQRGIVVSGNQPLSSWLQAVDLVQRQVQ